MAASQRLKLSRPQQWNRPKAAERSRSIKKTPRLLSSSQRMSLCTLRRALSVPWYFLYADWFCSYQLFKDRCSARRTAFSTILEIKRRLDTGLKFFKLSTSNEGFFNKGDTSAFLKCVGNIALSKERFTILVITGTKISMCSLSIHVGIGSSAHDLEGDDVTSL